MSEQESIEGTIMRLNELNIDYKFEDIASDGKIRDLVHINGLGFNVIKYVEGVKEAQEDYFTLKCKLGETPVNITVDGTFKYKFSLNE